MCMPDGQYHLKEMAIWDHQLYSAMAQSAKLQAVVDHKSINRKRVDLNNK
jgi:hypothetical protein